MKPSGAGESKPVSYDALHGFTRAALTSVGMTDSDAGVAADVLVAVVAYGLATMLFGASTTFWVTVLALAGTGAADTVSMVMRQTIRQLSTPDELRGRMTSVNMIFYIGGPQLGELEAGLVAAAIGLAPSIILGGFGVICATVAIGVLVPALRNYKGET